MTPFPTESAEPLEQIASLSRGELTLWMFSRLVSALAHSHNRGVLHGDLKPANILIRNDGEPALLDFNLSRKLDGDTSVIAGGTLPYMAPETLAALMGQRAELGEASDIYSLGSTARARPR